jgi:hypothetical protein
MHSTSVIANPQLRCTHLHPAGHRCGCFALRGEPFCYHHHPSRPTPNPKPRRARAAAGPVPFGLPVLCDLRAVQIALADVALRIANNTLDTKRAGLLLQCLQTAAATHST